jgi:hypothetical protein
MAAHAGMAFGTHIVFTYGPLGFLQVLQLNYQGTSDLSFLFLFVLSTSVCGALVWSLRRTVPLPLAIVVAYVVAALTFNTAVNVEYVIGLVLIICVAILNRAIESPAPFWIWIGLGGILSISALLKVGLGPGNAVLLIITVACLPSGRWRAVEGVAIGATGTFCVSWFGTGNGLSNIVPFAKGSASTISGYSSAMSIEVPDRLYTYPLAAVVGVIVALFVLANGSPSRRSALGKMMLALVAIWLVFKEGFVRHDTHDLIFFALAPLLLVAFLPKRRPWVLVPGVLALTALFLFVGRGQAPLRRQPIAAVGNFASETATLISPGRSAAVIERSRQSLRSGYGIPNGMVHMMAGQTVDISPWEQNVAWTYPQIHFDPLPVIQDYSAYTPSLDQLDTNYLASSDAPRFILRLPEASVDGRNPAFEPPAAQLSIECRYRQVAGSATWQLLERGSNRCGPLRTLRDVMTGFGRWFAVPTAPAGDSVIARFQLSQGWLSGLESIVFKPASVYVQYNGNRNLSWRFIAATASDPHVLRAASTLGYYTGFLPITLSTLRFSVAGGYPTTSGVKVSFYQVRVAPASGSNGEVLPPFTTEVRRPAAGAHLSGTQLLDAVAQDGSSAINSLKVTKVQFYLMSPSRQEILIGTGGQSLYGWIALWNTATVASGTYVLHSVAFDSAGRRSQSQSVTVSVTRS